MYHWKADESVLSVPRYCMIVAGIWIAEVPTRNITLNKIYKFYSGFVKIYMPTFLVSLYIEFALTMTRDLATKSLQELLKSFGYTISLTIAVLAAIMCQRNKVVEFITYVVEEERKIAQCHDSDISHRHWATVQFCRKFNLAIFAFTFSAALGIVSENITNRAAVEQYNKQYNASFEKPFIYELYYYKLDKEKHATFLLLLNYMFLIINSFVVISTRTMFTTCIIFMSSVLRNLQIKCRKSIRTHDDVLTSTKILVMEHQEIIGATENLNDAIKYLIFMEYLLNSVTLATIAIIPLLTSDRSMLAAPILSFGVIFILIMALGLSANEIQIQSLSLADALYDCTWYDETEVVKKLLLTMIMRAHRPLKLTIGPFAMTIESSLKIIKTSYSYVSVMMNSYKED